MAGSQLTMRYVLLALVAVLGAVTLPVIGTAPLSAQCHVCEQGDCADGAGGSTCDEHHSGGSQTCQVSGGCTCVKVERSFWFDGQECTPTFASSDLSPHDIRYTEMGGTQLALRRVGASHFAASTCGMSGEWAVLARELPDGELMVTTNPFMIRLGRWAFGLQGEFASEAGEDG